jgi:hypothetical protein
MIMNFLIELLTSEREKAMHRFLIMFLAIVMLFFISACTTVVHPPRHVHHRHARVKVWVPGHFNHHGAWIHGHWIKK